MKISFNRFARPRLHAALALVLLAFTAGCQPEMTSATVELITTPPLDVEVTDDRVVIPEGVAVAVSVFGFDDEGEDVGDLMVEASTVVIATNDSNRFIFFGSEVGEYTVSVGPAEGSGSHPIHVEVIPQTMP